MSFAENLEKLGSIEDVSKITLYQDGKEIGDIPNKEGKKGSLQVYSDLIGFENGSIDKKIAEGGLDLFAEHTEDAMNNPGKHPNIDFLLNVNEDKSIKAVIEYKIPSDLQERVEKFAKMKANGTIKDEKSAALDTFHEVVNLLEKGYLRTAQFTGKGWEANKWVKEGIMLGFSLGNIINYDGGTDLQFSDKETFPLRKVPADAGFRVVPPAAGLRRGAYAGKGCVFMPPAYANVGAYIGQGTMVENLAGSCCQVGRDSHISAGAIIGGVLDPMEATPVILGDNVLMGEGSGITQGSRLDDLVVLAPGVHISKATPVLDPINGVAYTSKGTVEIEQVNLSAVQGGGIKIYRTGKLISEKDPSYGPEIPKGALIIPSLSIASNGTLKVTPSIAKYINNKDERAYALEEALRE